MHGARKRETIKQGADHPQYRHGKRTKAYEEESSRTTAKLEALEALGYAMDYMIGPKTKGRKSKAYPQALRELIEDIKNLPPEQTRTPIS